MLTLTTFPVFRKSPSKETPTKKTPFQSYWLSSARGCCKRCHHCHRHPFGAAECTSLWFPRGLSDLQRAWMKWSPDGMGRWFHKIGFRGIKRTEWISIDIFFWGGSKQHKRCKMQHSFLDLGRWSFSSVCVEFCFLWQSIGSTSVQSGTLFTPFSHRWRVFGWAMSSIFEPRLKPLPSTFFSQDGDASPDRCRFQRILGKRPRWVGCSLHFTTVFQLFSRSTED